MQQLLKTLLVAFAAIASLNACGAERPNIVIFHCHDLGQFLHCYGVRTVRTPNFDKFAQQGVRFARSFCTQPGCSSSRASLFTGRYPHSNGVMGLTHANFAWDLRPQEKHLAQFLQEAGYATVAVGNVHETRSGAQRCGYEKHINQVKAEAGTTAAIAELTRLASGKQPFYLYAGFIEPHRLPYPRGTGPMSGLIGFPGPHLQPDDALGVDVPGYLRDTEGSRQELGGLQGAVRHVDEQFGRWMQALRELGLENNTLVIVTTDHGIATPRAKCSVYEPGLQVALLLRHAGRRGWRGGVVRNEMVSNIDVLPSILELVGIPIPANVQGRSFAPLLDGRPYTPNAAIFAELTYHNYYDPRRSIRTETHKLIANFSSAPAFQDPSQQWRPKSDTVTPENPAAAYHPHLELYDLAKDPWEQADLASKREHARLRDELARRLYRHMVETADPLLRGAVTSPQHETTLNMLRGEPAAASRTPSPEEAVARFTAKVKWIEQIGKREANAMPIGRIDLRWLLGIEILSVEKADQLFARKGEEILLIHSPALFCRESDQKKILGKQYSFKVFGELKDGVPRYYDAEVTEVRSREKKGFHHSKGRRP